MTNMIIDLPETVFSALRKAPTEFIKEMRIEAATQWYAQQRISRSEFINELANRHISVDQVNYEELMEEVRRE